MTRPTLTLDALNKLDQDAFTAALGHIFEDSPWVAHAAWAQRPFASVAALHAAMCDVVARASVAQQLALIRAHPDLVGRAARTGSLGPESTQEQAAAGLNALSADEVATFDQLNGAYRERFGFPFVICARENKKDSILRGFHERLGNSREQEIATALGEIAKIAHLRLRDVFRD
jgi:2-oxo-4-hydroxy-4-carboxy-5-ureidoimidazoline decarboxylase